MSRHVVVRQGVPPLAARLWGAPVRVQEKNRTPLGIELQQSNSRTQRRARARAEARGATPDASRSGIASPRLEPRGPCRGPVFRGRPARRRARRAAARAIRAREERARARGRVRRDASQRARHGRRRLSTREQAIRFRHRLARRACPRERPTGQVRPLRRVACLPVPRARNARDARVAEMRASPSRRPVPCGSARFSLARADGVITKPIPRSGHRSRARSSTNLSCFFSTRAVCWQCSKRTNAVIGGKLVGGESGLLEISLVLRRRSKWREEGKFVRRFPAHSASRARPTTSSANMAALMSSAAVSRAVATANARQRRPAASTSMKATLRYVPVISNR